MKAFAENEAVVMPCWICGFQPSDEREAMKHICGFKLAFAR
jgi:hypothetical protein